MMTTFTDGLWLGAFVVTAAFMVVLFIRAVLAQKRELRELEDRRIWDAIKALERKVK